ncbi:unnamed protein product [Sphagnum balticum]
MVRIVGHTKPYRQLRLVSHIQFTSIRIIRLELANDHLRTYSSTTHLCPRSESGAEQLWGRTSFNFHRPEALTDYYARRLTADNYGSIPNPEIGGGSGFDAYMVYHWQTYMLIETEDVYGAPLNAVLGDVPRIRTGVEHALVGRTNSTDQLRSLLRQNDGRSRLRRNANRWSCTNGFCSESTTFQ